MSDSGDQIREAVRRSLEQQIEKKFAKSLYVDTVTNQNQAPFEEHLTLEGLSAMVKVWDRMMKQARQDDLTIIVRGRHASDMLRWTDEFAGMFVMCSWEQAMEIHKRAPLVLFKIWSEDMATFKPATAFDIYVPKTLPRPPFKIASNVAPNLNTEGEP